MLKREEVCTRNGNFNYGPWPMCPCFYVAVWLGKLKEEEGRGNIGLDAAFKNFSWNAGS